MCVSVPPLYTYRMLWKHLYNKSPLIHPKSFHVDGYRMNWKHDIRNGWLIWIEEVREHKDICGKFLSVTVKPKLVLNCVKTLQLTRRLDSPDLLLPQRLQSWDFIVLPWVSRCGASGFLSLGCWGGDSRWMGRPCRRFSGLPAPCISGNWYAAVLQMLALPQKQLCLSRGPFYQCDNLLRALELFQM